MTKSTHEILRDGADTFESKTEDYGSSWKSIGYILTEMAHGEPITLETPREIIAFGLFTRRLDKLSREFYGTFFADDMNFEGPVDSAEDESVYASMSAENLYDMAEAADPEKARDGLIEELEAAASVVGMAVVPEEEPAASGDSDDTPFERFRPSELREDDPEYPAVDFTERVLLWADDLVDCETVLFEEEVIDEFPRTEESEMAFQILDDSTEWEHDSEFRLYQRA